MRDLILSEIVKIPAILGNLLFDVVVTTRAVSTIDRVTNKPKTAVGVSKSYKALIDEFKSNEVSEYGVQVGDIKLLVFCDGDEIVGNSTVLVNSNTYEILKALPIYVGSIIAVTTLHLRK